MRRAAIALAFPPAVFAAAALAAQTPRWDQIPKINGAPRDTVAEAARLAALATGAQIRIWLIPGSVENLVRMYRRSLEAEMGPPPDSVLPTGNSRVSYYVDWHTFADECMDSTAGAPAADGQAPACQRWRYGKDKRRSLQLRTTFNTYLYVKSAVFTWFRHEPDGLVRFRVSIEDLSLSDDWKGHTPLARLTLESAPIPEGSR